MLYREIIAVCSQIHTEHINTLCGQNVELLNVKLAVHIVTTELQTVSNQCSAKYLHSQTIAGSTIAHKTLLSVTMYQSAPLGQRSVARSEHCVVVAVTVELFATSVRLKFFFRR